MSVPSEIVDQFRAGKRSEQVRFVLNDAVQVTVGAHKTRTGVVSSIFSLEPVTTYLVEPDASPWGDFQVAQSALELRES